MAQSIPELYAENEKISRELNQLQTALGLCNAALDSFKNEEEDQITTDRATSFAKEICQLIHVDYDEILGEEAGLEALRDIPGKVWRMIAQLITTIKNKLKALFAALLGRFQKQTKIIGDTFDTFDERVLASEETIKRFSLDPGKTLDNDTKEKLTQAKAFVFMDRSGHVLSKSMYYRDMTLLVPEGYLKNSPDILRAFVVDKKLQGIPGALEQTNERLGKLLCNFDLQLVIDLFTQVLNIKKNDDFLEFDRRVKKLNLEQENIIQSARLKKQGIYYTERSIIGDVWPTFWFDRKIAGVSLLNCMFSYEQGRLTPNPTPVNNLKLKTISYDELKEIYSLTSALETNRIAITNRIMKFGEDLERMIGSSLSTSTLAETSDRLSNMIDGRNDADIKRVQTFLTRSNDIRQTALSALTESQMYLTKLIERLNQLLVLILGVGK